MDDNNLAENKKIKMTPQQVEILSSSEGIKRVIACAGSGKTLVLTNSIANILRKQLCRPDEILAITFTRNAAENMRLKIKGTLRKKMDFNAIDIFTFNGFGNHIISENSFLMGLGKGYKLINISKSWHIIYEIVRKSDFKSVKIGKDRGSFVEDVLRFIWDLKSNLVTPDQLESYSLSFNSAIAEFKSAALHNEESEIAAYQYDLCMVYKEYECIKKENNLVDYHDHIFLPYILLSENKDIRNRYREKYRYLFIDEFQDTDVAQARLITLLYNPGFNSMMIVGDDDQGIYSFRGACIENILNFHRWEIFSGYNVRDYYLTTNFRSGESIIKAIGDVISANNDRFNKDFNPEHAGKESDILFFSAATLRNEAELIASNIIELRSRGIREKDIAILSRRKRFGHITEALEKNNIKYELVSSRGFYYEPEILFIVSWLMVINDTGNVLYLINILQSDKFKISDRDIFFLRNFDIGINSFLSDKEVANRNFIMQILDNDKNPYIGNDAKKRLSEFIGELKYYISQSSFLKLGELISLIYEHSGMADEFKAGFEKSLKLKIKNIETLIKIGSDFDSEDMGNSLNSFIVYLKDVAKTDEEDPDSVKFSNSNAVKIMTIHASKGLEFEVVFLPMLWKSDYPAKPGQKRFKIPSMLRKDRMIYTMKGTFTSKQKFDAELKKQHLEEERRIFYVGCSRAKRYLFLSHCFYENERHAQDQDKKQKEPLPFLEEVFKSGIIKYLDTDFSIQPGTRDSDSIFFSPQFIKKSEELLVSNLNMVDIEACKTNEKYSSYINALHGLKRMPLHDKPGKNSISKRLFSLTEILDYIKCPQRYKWKYIYNVPEPALKSSEMGEKVHNNIQMLTMAKFGGIVERNYMVSLENASGIRATENLLMQQNPEAGECLGNYINSEFYQNADSQKIIIEQLFYWHLAGYMLSCKIDRLDLLNNRGFRIIDYKSSGFSKGKKGEDHINQLKAYTAGVSDMYSVEYGKIKCFLFYLKDGFKAEYRFNKNDIDILIASVTGAIDKINNRDFKILSGMGEEYCGICSYMNLCKSYS